MDYLDTRKQAWHSIMLFLGYILVTIAIALTAIILLYKAYGFSFGSNGTVIQNGLVYFSSQPNPAQIYINNDYKPKANTNTSVYLPAGFYNFRLSRAGYYDWTRTIEVDGGNVEHYDYPFLFPKILTTNKIASYNAAPGLVTQSPDRRWLLVNKPPDANNPTASASALQDFDIYDLKNPTKAPASGSLPDNLLTKASSGESWVLGEWSNDNQHLILIHNFDNKREYILMDRSNPGASVNLSDTLGINAATTALTLDNTNYDQYYLFDSSSGSLQTATLSDPSTKTTVIQRGVLAYKTYGGNTVLFVTADGAPAGKVLVKLLSAGSTSAVTIRDLPASSNYVLDLTQYNGTLFVAAGASSTPRVYIYQDPLGQLASSPGQALVPAQVLNVPDPNYLNFSANAQFIVVESGKNFGVYDIENNKGYNYSVALAPDQPIGHATWMDGDRLYFVSSGKLDVFDYDHTNAHTLVSAASQFLPIFAPDYKYVYTLANSTTSPGQYDLNQTWLLAPQDRP